MYQTKFYIRISGTVVKKQKHLHEISGRELHNDLILPVSQGGIRSL